MHKIPILWEFHKIHHSATSLNPITQYRLHPLELLINTLENIAINQGYEIILSVGRNKGLIETHKKLGYAVDDNPSYEISKKII